MNVTSNTIATSARRERLSRLGILEEPMGYVDGQNLYEFVGSAPVGNTDPLGLQTRPVAPRPATAPATRPATGPATRPATQPAFGWGDFRGQLPTGDQAEDAYIHMEMAANRGRADVQAAKDPCDNMWNATAKYPNYTVTASMDKAKSWVRPGEQNPKLLRHEYYHLVLTYVGATRATQKLREVTGQGSGPTEPAAKAAAIRDLNEKTDAAFSAALMSTQEQTDAYDAESEHSRNDAGQRKWERQLDEWKRTRTWWE